MLEKYSSGENGQAGVIDGEERDNNLVILAFPTNDFHQEPGTNEEIEETVKGLLGEQYDNENFILFHKVCFPHWYDHCNHFIIILLSLLVFFVMDSQS